VKFVHYTIIADEQERIQKATFTRWCNAHLAKCTPPRELEDLYVDLRDGVALCQLTEVLTGDKLVRYNPVLKLTIFNTTIKLISINHIHLQQYSRGAALKRVHHISNLTTALQYL
jgi:hypothetical protein